MKAKIQRHFTFEMGGHDIAHVFCDLSDTEKATFFNALRGIYHQDIDLFDMLKRVANSNKLNDQTLEKIHA